jgi:hypothetical protein
LGCFAALPSEAAPLGPASALKIDAAGSGNVQTVSHRWNHRCGWRRGYRVCWWSHSPWFGPSIYFRFGPDRRSYRYRDHHSRYYWNRRHDR